MKIADLRHGSFDDFFEAGDFLGRNFDFIFSGEYGIKKLLLSFKNLFEFAGSNLD